jgi:hypothetical protein
MRAVPVFALLLPLLISACGRDRTVVVAPQPAVVTPAPSAGTVVVPQGGTTTKVCPPGTVC